jgi:hypothetical protein
MIQLADEIHWRRACCYRVYICYHTACFQKHQTSIFNYSLFNYNVSNTRIHSVELADNNNGYGNSRRGLGVRYYPRMYLDGMKRPQKPDMTVGVSDVIRTGHLLNKNRNFLRQLPLSKTPEIKLHTQ